MKYSGLKGSVAANRHVRSPPQTAKVLEGAVLTRYHLVLFATEGAPVDRGLDLTPAAQCLARVASRQFQTVKIYTPRELCDQDSTWGDTLRPLWDGAKGSVAMPNKLPNWSEIGGNLWKPRLLLEICQQGHLGEDDIVVYHDSNVFKYPEYRLNVSDAGLEQIDRLASGYEILLFRDTYRPMLTDVKRDLLVRHVPQRRWLRSHIWSGCLTFRASPAAQSLLASWYALSSFPGALDSSQVDPFRVYQWNSVDQATLSALLHSRLYSAKFRRLVRVCHLGGGRQIALRGRVSHQRINSVMRGAHERLRSIPDLIQFPEVTLP